MSTASSAPVAAQPIERARQLQGFWSRQFAIYLLEHRHPLNRATHMVGIPVIVITMAWGLLALDWRVFVGGQVIGWAFQLLGHRIEGNRPALLKNPISFLIGPLMVLVEILGSAGVRPAFARRALDAVALPH